MIYAGLAFAIGWAIVGRLEQGIRWSWLWVGLGREWARGPEWVSLRAVLFPKSSAGDIGRLVEGWHLKIFWRWPIEIKFYPPHPRLWVDRVHGE